MSSLCFEGGALIEATHPPVRCCSRSQALALRSRHCCLLQTIWYVCAPGVCSVCVQVAESAVTVQGLAAERFAGIRFLHLLA